MIFSPRLQNGGRGVRAMFDSPALRPFVEHTANLAVDAAAIWPYMRDLAQEMRRLSPQAVFASVVNPADVLASAFQKAFGFTSVAVCVEVQGLCDWLSYYLRTPREHLELEYIGANHFGWVSRWNVKGVDDARKLMLETIPPRMRDDDWLPHASWFVTLYELTGYMRTSPYHTWPARRLWDESMQRQNQRWEAACLGGVSKRDYRAQEARTGAGRRQVDRGRGPAPHASRIHFVLVSVVASYPGSVDRGGWRGGSSGAGASADSQRPGQPDVAGGCVAGGANADRRGSIPSADGYAASRMAFLLS